MEKRYVVITGASSGIGYKAALEFAKLGKNLALVARRVDKLEEVKKEINEINSKLDVKIYPYDLSINENVYKLYDELKSINIETLINNAGFGHFKSVCDQDLDKVTSMIRLNIDALTILSTLYVRDYKNVEGSQLINVSSVVGYVVSLNVISYSATKFYVSAFTEGLSMELKKSNSKLKAKILAPAATETEFVDVGMDTTNFDYSSKYSKYHTSKEMAKFLVELYSSDKTIGKVNMETYDFELFDNIIM